LKRVTRVYSLREMESTVDGCSHKETTTAAETLLSPTNHDIERSTSESHADDADADADSDVVFTVAETGVTASPRQQPTTSVTSAEDEEERADEAWDAATEDSTTICGLSLDNDDDDDDDEVNTINVDGRAPMSDLRTHSSDVG